MFGAIKTCDSSLLGYDYSPFKKKNKVQKRIENLDRLSIYIASDCQLELKDQMEILILREFIFSISVTRLRNVRHYGQTRFFGTPG